MSALLCDRFQIFSVQHMLDVKLRYIHVCLQSLFSEEEDSVSKDECFVRIFISLI